MKVRLRYEDATEEDRCFPEGMVPRIGDIISTYNTIKKDVDIYRVKDVVWDINFDPSASTQLNCVHIYLKDLD